MSNCQCSKVFGHSLNCPAYGEPDTTDPSPKDKIQMSIGDLLRWVRLGIVNGNREAAIALLDDAISQWEEYEAQQKGAAT